MALKLPHINLPELPSFPVNVKGRYEFRSMRERLLVWMMLIAVVPVILLVLIGLTYAERQLQLRAIADLSDTASRLHHDISTAVTDPLETVRVFSRSPYLHQALKDFVSVYEPDDLYSMDYQDMQDNYWGYFSLYAEKHLLRDLLLLNRHGDVVFSAVQSDLYGSSVNHVDYTGSGVQAAYRNALWQMDAAIAFAREPGEGAYAYLASPVVEDSLVGVIILIPESESLRQLLGNHSHGGQMVSLYRENGSGVYEEVIGEERIERTSTIGKRITAAILGRDFNGELSYWDGDWLVSVRALPALRSVMVLRRDRDIVLESVQQLRYSGWGITFIVLLLTLVLSRRLSLNIAAPIRKLTNSVERISRGDREVNVDVQRKDELGRLAQQFNLMTASLRETQAQLVQSEKMASIGHLAAGVAHEINNPMSVVTANMNTMQEYASTYVKLADLFERYLDTNNDSDSGRAEVLNELKAFEQEEDIQFVHQDMKALLQDSQLGLSRVKHIVSSLKIFSELDKSEDEDIDLLESLEQVVSEIAPASSRTTEISYQIELDGTVRIKPEQMRRVYAAIIDNAIRACSEKGSLRVKAWRENDVLIIDFQDTGCGMAKEQVSQVFDPFYTTREVGEGIGLGLSVAHSIVEAHGGQMVVASREGRGTRVRITLPGR